MTAAEIATLLAASGALAVSLAGAFVSVWNAVHISKVHTLVNGQSKHIEAMAQAQGYAEGHAAGEKSLGKDG